MGNQIAKCEPLLPKLDLQEFGCGKPARHVAATHIRQHRSHNPLGRSPGAVGQRRPPPRRPLSGSTSPTATLGGGRRLRRVETGAVGGGGGGKTLEHSHTGWSPSPHDRHTSLQTPMWVGWDPPPGLQDHQRPHLGAGAKNRSGVL